MKGNWDELERERGVRADLEDRGVVVGQVGLREMAAPPIPVPLRVIITAILTAAGAAAGEDRGSSLGP